jgi:hypothetical protein
MSFSLSLNAFLTLFFGVAQILTHLKKQSKGARRRSPSGRGGAGI